MFKKSFTFLLLTLALIPLFAGCGSETPPETMSGIVAALDKKTYAVGTHLLTQANKPALILESFDEKEIKLDQYLNKTVSVTGVVTPEADDESGLGLMSVTKIELQTADVSTSTDLSTNPAPSLTHTNSQFGFSLNYPSNLGVATTARGTAFTTAAGEKLYEVIVFENSAQENLLDWLMARYGYTSAQLTPIGLNNLSGYKFQNATGVAIYLGVKTSVYTLVWYDSDEQNRVEHRKNYLALAQSFTAPGATQNSNSAATDLGTTIDSEFVTSSNINAMLPQIAMEELKRGWYYGDMTTKKPGTPVTWVLTGSGTRSAMWQRPAGAPIESSVSLPTANADLTKLSSDQQKVFTYLSTKISALAPEPPASGAWSVEQIAFAEPSYVYAIYKSDTETRKLLFIYSVENEAVSVVTQAYFRPGEDRDWLVSEGADSAFGRALTIVNANGAVSSVRAGYRVFMNTRYPGYSLQYPKNWYWQANGADQTDFSDAPFPAGLVRITVRLVNSTGFRYGALISEGENYAIYAKLSNTQSLKISGAQIYAEILTAMAETATK